MLQLLVMSRAGVIVKKNPLNANANSQGVLPGQMYQIVDADTGKVPKSLRIKRISNDLVIEGSGQDSTLTLNNFYTDCAAGEQCFFLTKDSVPSVSDISHSSGLINAEAAAQAGVIAPNSPSIAALDGGNALIYADTEASKVVAAMHGIGGLLAAGGTALTAVAIEAGGGSGAVALAAAKALKTLVLSGSITAGPFISDSTVITAYDNVGNILGRTTVGLDGKFTLNLNSNYVGTVLVVATDSNSTGSNYFDEASGAGTDLGNARLSKVSFVVEGSTVNTIVAHITPLSELAALKLGASADNVAPSASAQDIASNDDKIAKLFGLNTINVQPIAINSPEYNEADGLNDGEKLGRVLAALSGADNTAGGSLTNTLSQVSNSIDIHPLSGQFTFAQSAIDLLADGIATLENGINGGLTVASLTLVSSINVPIIDTARNGISLSELNNTNIAVSSVGSVVGGLVKINWGNQVFTHTLTTSDIASGVVNINVPPSIIQAAGNGDVLVNTVFGSQAPSDNSLISVNVAAPIEITPPVVVIPPAVISPPATAGTAIDNVGVTQGTLAANATTDDNTPSLSIAAPPLGQTAVLFVDGVEVVSLFVPGVGLLPTTLTPTLALADGVHTLSYAYRDALLNISAESPTVGLTVLAPVVITPPVAAGTAIDNVGLTQGTLAANATTDDNTPSLSIAAPPLGQTAVLFVDGVEVVSLFVPGVGLLPTTLTPTLALADGVHTLSYA